MRVRNVSFGKFALVVVLTGLLAGACGSSSSGGNDAGARGGSGGSSAGGKGGGSGGTTGVGGTTGAAGATGHGGSGGASGSTGSAGTTGGAGTAGTQPVGAACVNTGNCSQADGPAVCCLQISTCVLENQCAGSTTYVPCTDTASCNKGGWICCNAGGMHFCTKQSGCPSP